MTSPPKLSIIIPTWNNVGMLRLCLSSISRHTTLSHQVILHVNGGEDGTLDWVRRQGVDHTWTPANVGICEALNRAFERCRGEYVVYLNDDMYVLPGWDRPLYEAVAAVGPREPCYAAGTMIQTPPISPTAIRADYGSDPQRFDEDRILSDHRAGSLRRSDWNGATWPPCCIHRRWWKQVGGYSAEFHPGFYSDIDFSMKLWQLGCRRYHGIGSSLVYHFGEKTTSLVRGPKKRRVKEARLLFFRKWGVLPSTFTTFYLRVHEEPKKVLPESGLRGAAWERLRLRILAIRHGVRCRPALRPSSAVLAQTRSTPQPS